MKLSKETLAIIKNYASINSNLLLKQGNKLSTLAVGSTIMSTVTINETFPADFAIYDVNEFLGVLSLFEDPDLDFSDKYATIKQGSGSIKYFAAASEAMVVPKKDIVFPDAEVNFTLDANIYSMILKTAPLLKTSDVSFVGNGSTIAVVVVDKKNQTGNAYTYELGTTTLSFKVNLKIENLKMLPGSYDVSISSKKISRFAAKNAGDLVYYVAIEADSTFEV